MKSALMAVVAIMLLGFLGTTAPLHAADNVSMEDANKDLDQKIKQTKEGCFSCHTKDGLAKRTSPSPDADRLSHLQIDPVKFDQSVHADVFCADCHGEGVNTVPHQGNFRGPVTSCPECHKRQRATLVPEFQQSVHVKLRPNVFTCYSCHDPHNVRKAASLGEKRNVAHRDNSMCLGCHSSDAQYAKVALKKRPDLLRAHSWQPNPELHWSAVRCIDCHTPEKPNGGISHDVLPKGQAERHCVDCHSTDSSLLTRLYRHEVEGQRINAAGFINAYILTQAYVVGVTRNAYLDWASLILLVAMVAGLACHGMLRYVGYRARKGRK
jgi:predicted CXXCH cytochrome family protein